MGHSITMWTKRGKKMSVFVHAQGIKTDHTEGGGVTKGLNSVHVVVECPLRTKVESFSWVIQK